MSNKLAEAYVEVEARDAAMIRTLGRTRDHLGRFVKDSSSIMSGVSTAVSGSIIAAATAVAAATAGWLKGAVLDAGNLNETLSKAETTFGSASGKIIGFADNMAAKFGSAKREVIDAASSFGLIFKGAGMAEDASAKLAITLATAADDAASLFNSELPEALDKIRAGLVGESEPLRAYGVMLTEAAVQQEAMRLGLAKNKNELSEQAKIMARASLIEKGLAIAKGDHAKTQTGLNNQIKEFGDRMKNFGVAVGSLFTTPLAIAFQAVNKLLQGVTWLFEKVGWLIWAFGGFNRKVEETAKVADTVNEKARKPATAPAPAGPAAGVAASTKKAPFDARAEVLKDEASDAERKAVDKEKEKRDAELKEKRRKEMDYAIATRMKLLPSGASEAADRYESESQWTMNDFLSGDAFSGKAKSDIEKFRRNANFNAEREKIEGFLSGAKAKVQAVVGLAGQLKNDALGVAGNVVDALVKKRPKMEGGVTDSDSYAREIQNAALNNDGTQEKLLEEAKKVPDKLDEVIKLLGKGGRDIIARFG